MEHARFDLVDHNARIFFKPKLASWYAGEPLSPPEAMILIRHRDAFAGKRVLDLGVGSGRTTRYLLPFASTYLGTDVSPPMLAACRSDWPDAEIQDLDLRDLARLMPRQFEFILASNGVFDVLTHELRLKALGDCGALLVPGGMLVFSAHNRRHQKAGTPPVLELSGSAVRWPMTAAHFLRDHMNHRKMRGFEERAQDYALLNDVAHGYQGVFYYVDRPTQKRQLETLGFALVGTVGDDARMMAEAEDDRDDGMLHYICRKRPA